MASVAVTLFDLEESLTALLDTQDMVAPQDEQAFLAEFETALATATDKRDRVAGRLARLEAQQAFAAAEIKRLQEFKKQKAAEQERLESYVTYVIERIGKDAKGKYRKLEGNSSSLALRACAASVEITDESAVPLDYKRATVHMSASTWNDILGVIAECTPTFYTAIQAPGVCETSLTVDRIAIKATIQAGEFVSGAKLVTDKTTVGRK